MTRSKSLATIVDVYSFRTGLENFFLSINNLHQNINFTLGEECNGKLVFLVRLLKGELNKENTRIKQEPKENKYQQYIISKA